MQWAANSPIRKYLVSVAAILILVFISLLLTSRERVSGEFFPLADKEVSILTCFDPATNSLRVTSEDFCPQELISLGGGALTESATATGEVNSLHPLLQARFSAAKATAELDGVHLYITSGFRSFARQDFLYHREIELRGSETEAAKWVLPAQFSHHPHGLAIDVNYPGDRAGAQWLEANGARFGLCRVYANEWWHFEGVIAPGQSCPKMSANALVDLG